MSTMQGTSNTPRVSAYVYSVFRVLLGAFLTVHFVHLLPWAAEVFSSHGMLPEGSLSPLFGIIPNLLAIADYPAVVQALLASAAIASVMVLAGYKDRAAAVWIWYVLACTFARNPLIANPSLPLVGWMVLAHAFVPQTPVGRLGTWQAPDPSAWRMPRAVWISAWIILALSYSYSGYTKLLSPSWVAGENVAIVLNNPLARDYFLRDWLLALPSWSLNALTWFILWVELLFAPLALIRRLRPWLWGMMLFVQFGFLVLLNFPDLTFPMLLIHLLTFDARWIRARHPGRIDTIFYDGDCGLCHGVVRRVIAEDHVAGFRFAPIGSEAFVARLDSSTRNALPDSFIVQTQDGEILLKSDAALYVMRRFGGLYVPTAGVIGILPKVMRDGLYDFVGRNRLRWFQSPQAACPLLPPNLKQRFLEV